MSKLPLLAHLRSLVDTLRGSYWFLPMMMALGAGVAAFALVEVDRRLLVTPIPWISSTGPEGTRAVLSVIAGSMITVTGVVFSITVVALTLASSQFGPRLLRNFLRDRTNQFAFGAFVATFLYSLLVLRTVRAQEIPHLAATVAVVLATISMFVLIYFIHNTATSIQASNVLASVAKEIEAHLPTLFPHRLGSEDASTASPSVETFGRQLDADGADVMARSDGFVRVIDHEAVLRLAQQHDALVLFHCRPGDFLTEGAFFARVGPATLAEDTGPALWNSMVVGDLRTPVQDLGMLIDQLTEIALRALSPGVNDPTTAVDCVRRLGAVVSAVADRQMPSGAHHDSEGRLRLLAPPTTFEEIVAACFDPIRRYGAAHTPVTVAMLDAIWDVGCCCAAPNRRSILAEHARELQSDFRRHDQSPRDIALVERAFERAMARVGD